MTSMTTGTVALDTAEVGDMVLWSPDYGGRPSPAMVVAIGVGDNRSRIDLHVVHPETMTLDHRTGVPHREDPRNKIITDEEIGVWQVGSQTLRIQRLEEEVEELKLSLAGSPKGLGELVGEN